MLPAKSFHQMKVRCRFPVAPGRVSGVGGRGAGFLDRWDAPLDGRPLLAPEERLRELRGSTST